MWRKRKQRDFQAEIDAHLQLEADQLREDGLAQAEAQTAARRVFGNRAAAEERFYESSRWTFAEHLLRDLRFAARVLAKDRRFSVLAVLGLALGIGVTTSIFALISASVAMETTMDGPDAASLVGLHRSVKGRNEGDLSYPAWRYLRDHARSFRDVKAESSRERFILAPPSGSQAGAAAEETQARFESANFLSAPGLHPALGRSFTAEEEQLGNPPVAVLDFKYWKSHFDADPAVLGKTVALNGQALTIVGVADARYGAGDLAGFYLPLGLQPLLLKRGDWIHDPLESWLMTAAWLRAGVTARQAQAEMDVLAPALQTAQPAIAQADGVLVTPGGVNPRKRRELLALVVAVTLAVSMILLIACSNLANLLLARAVVRRREIGVRLSLGASRTRLVCQLLTESMLLALAGGALGLVISDWLAKALVRLMSTPGLAFDLHLEPRVVLYTFALSVAAGLSFGLAPALSATRTNLSQALHAEGLNAGEHSQSRRIWSARNALAIVPLAVSLMLLLGAGVAVRDVQRGYLEGPAFDATRLVGVSFRLNMQGYDEARTRQFQDRLLARVTNMPGVASAALATSLPLSNGLAWLPLMVEGSAIVPDAPHADYNIVTPGFFATTGARIVRGRNFTDSDRESAPPVALVNQELARQYWPGEDPLGKRIRFTGGSAFFEVVGVAPDLEDATQRFNSVRPTVYVPFAQGKLLVAAMRTDPPPYQMKFLIRTGGSPAALKAALRQETLATDRTLLVTIQTIDEMLAERMGPLKTISMLLTALGGLALIMASVGIYAILAYAVSQRTREIGIRMALGAQRGEILSLVMQRTTMLIVVGIGAGLLGALALVRIFSSSLEKFGQLDAATCAVVSLLLAGVAMLAGYLPARKALRVDAVHALRYE